MQMILQTEIAGPAARLAAQAGTAPGEPDGFTRMLESTPLARSAVPPEESAQDDDAVPQDETPHKGGDGVDMAALLCFPNALPAARPDEIKTMSVVPGVMGEPGQGKAEPEKATVPVPQLSDPEGVQVAGVADAPVEDGGMPSGPSSAAGPAEQPAIEPAPDEARPAGATGARMVQTGPGDAAPIEGKRVPAAQASDAASQSSLLASTENARSRSTTDHARAADVPGSDAQAGAADSRQAFQPPQMVPADDRDASGQDRDGSSGDEILPDAENGLAETGRAEPRTQDTRLPAPARPEILRQVAQPLIEAIRHDQRGGFELSLSPEELGRVRFAFIPSEHGIAIAISTDRADTLDLIRRHIGMLQDDFRQLGYGDVAFDFAGGSQRSPDDRAGRIEPTIVQPQQDIASTRPERSDPTVSSGLDLRL